jgi:PAS domain S-box-containing protein
VELPLQTIINSLEDAIISMDESFVLIFLNEAAAKLFGCDESKVLGQPATLIPALGAVLNELKLAEMHLSSESPKALRRLEGRRADGERFPMEALVTCSALPGRNFFTVRLRDISFQEQMEKAVYQSRKIQAIGALAGGVAHDFNNILTAVISQIDLALSAKDLPAALKENLNYAKAGTRRGAELASQLQVFSRQAKTKPVPLDLSGLVDQVVFMLRHCIDPGIQIKYEPPRIKLWPVSADAGQIMHALMNLGLNARDAMPEGGELVIQVENVFYSQEMPLPKRAGEFVKVTVRDTGQGMPPEVLARLFEPHLTTKDSSQRAGLGLPITASVIAEHGGWIEVQSRLSRGAQFHVFLPRTREEAPTDAARESLPADPGTLDGQERILLVDDEELVRVVMRTVLASRGYQIVEAADGAEAVQTYLSASQPFDLILIDLHMPRLSGADALVQIRQRDADVKAILLSGGVQDRDSEATIQLKVQFLQKPFENQELVELVREVLDAPVESRR